MMKKAIGYWLLAIGTLLVLLTANSQWQKASFAQAPACGSGTPARNEGLVTTPTVSGKFSSTGACITSDETIFVPFKIPTYDDLKSRYYTQSPFTKVEITTLPSEPTPSVTTQAETSVGQNSAYLNSSINPNGYATTAWFRWGDSSASCQDLNNATSPVSLGSGTTAVSGTTTRQQITGLSASTRYYFCAVAKNLGGTAYGTVLNFSTEAAGGGGDDDDAFLYQPSRLASVLGIMTVADQKLYHSSGDLSISTFTGTGTALIFVDGKLTITGNLIYGTANTGLVLVVGGDVVIDPSVTQIDAVIISAGTIYTAGAGCLPATVLTSPLNVNGSLISLVETNQIKFCRKLSLNDKPSEIINQQPKYLVILRDMFSETLQKWSEIP